MRKAAWTAALVVIAVFADGGAAMACDTTAHGALFVDAFDSLAATWGEASDALNVSDGKLVMKPEANHTQWAPNTAQSYRDVDLCAELTSVASVDANNSFSGVMFWYIDDDNYYAFEIDADGRASIWRRQRGRWLSQVDWVRAGALKPGDGSTNELRVVIKGNVASYYLNGDLFREGMGVPPDNGQRVGVIASSPKEGVATYDFDDFTVRKPE